jgi:teichuronic acid biosynthesis glycosyltransferase TuaH
MVQIGMEHVLQKSVESRLTDRLDYDIVILATARWDGNYSSTSYSLAKALSKYTRVFYIDNPFTLKAFFKGRDQEGISKRRRALLHGEDIFMTPDPAYPNLTNVTPQLVLPINWMSKGFMYNVLSKINDSIVSKAFNTMIGQFNIRKYLFINCFNPHFGKYFNLSKKPFCSVYYNVDDMSQGPYVKKHGVYLEADAMRNADFTMVTSTELKKLSERYSRNVVLLPNAANVELFQTAVKQSLPVPEEIQSVPSHKKIISYIGNICYRLDYDLLIKIAKEHSDKVLVMIGPFANDHYLTSGLKDMPNVIFTGRKNLEDLPAYLQHSDCCIIPFLCNQLTKSIYPLKINEYLSSGKPVVTTNFSEDIRSFSDIIHVSDTHAEFVYNINKAISTDSAALQQRRVARAEPNSWEDRARQFTVIVEEFLQWKK